MEEREKGVGDVLEGLAAGANAGVDEDVWVVAEETEEDEEMEDAAAREYKYMAASPEECRGGERVGDL